MSAMYVYHFVILLLSIVVCGQNTTNASDQKTMSDLQNRMALLEKAVGKFLTGKDDVNFTNISGLKIRGGGFGIPGFNTTLVAFSALYGSDMAGISTGYILKFSSVITNLGNYYNPTDGIFVAPVHGLYMFQWTMICYTSGSNSCGTSLRVNNAGKGYLYSGENGNGYHHTGSKTVIVEVQAGNHVWVQTENWSNIFIQAQSSFTGCLLSIL
ncbi:complement C1q-like protein 2 [Saccostrea echinata]|uniref:complement C1q-like protein 2 n=1 Tax=Saccostrea echinata TaxID=191078 RepID=UPI002A826089|nr:complement C1q-like protein 2 [Saccostrea echinata]